MVVLLIGIIATIAAPKLLRTSELAVDNGLRHTVTVIREAIDNFSTSYPGKLPGEDGTEATFKSDMAPFLRGGRFPICTVGPAENNSVHMITGGGVAAAIAATQATHSWLYDYGSGEFYVNCDELSSDGVSYARF